MPKSVYGISLFILFVLTVLCSRFRVVRCRIIVRGCGLTGGSVLGVVFACIVGGYGIWDMGMGILYNCGDRRKEW